jgi:cytochrome c oxidase subunit II
MKRVACGMLAASALWGQQSALAPGGRNAQAIHALLVAFVGLLTAIFVTVVIMALVPLVRRHRGIEQEPLERTHQPGEATEKRLGIVVGIATALTVLILVGLVVVSVSVGKASQDPRQPGKGMTIEVTGNQWWWYVRYYNDQASRIVVDANEIHVPVGQQVMIRGTSNDVIHSFWVPGLQGKRDLIPSRVTTEWLEADRPGTFRGQCAEFCGLQHAHMAMWLVAHTPADFDAWMANQLKPAVEPSNSDEQRGQQVLLESACAMCHAIRGTPAAGQVGPDLTHFASRLTIAAGTLPNNKGNLGGWIADPQNIKPGTHMATVPVKAEDIQPLLDYLESLK